MRKKHEVSMNASTRKFIARRKYANCGLFKQKPLKRKPQITLEIKASKGLWENLTQFVSSTVRTCPSILLQVSILFSKLVSVTAEAAQETFYFSTIAGGKNVLETNKSANATGQILEFCNTSKLNTITPAIKLVLTLCDGSVIQALNGSLLLNNSDPTLQCIDDQFNSQCEQDCSFLSCNLGATIAGVFAGLVALAAVCYCWEKCCGSSNTDSRPSSGGVDTEALIREVDRRHRQRRAEYNAGHAIGTALCKIL